MDEEIKLVQVYSVNGVLEGEMVRMFLEANGVKAEVFQESAGIVYGLTVGPLGEARIYVPVDQKELAEQLLRDMEAGTIPSGELPAETSSENEDIPTHDGEENEDHK